MTNREFLERLGFTQLHTRNEEGESVFWWIMPGPFDISLHEVNFQLSLEELKITIHTMLDISLTNIVRLTKQYHDKIEKEEKLNN